MSTHPTLGDRLLHVRDSCDVRARLDADPVGIVHQYAHPLDRELVGLLASAVAFGRVRTIRDKLAQALEVLGPEPRRAVRELGVLKRRLALWRHRLYAGQDVARLLYAGGALQRAHGSMGAFVEAEWRASHSMRDVVGALARAIRREGGWAEASRPGLEHLVPNPDRAGAMKRMLLFFRWMSRPADGVDLGQWRLPTGALLCPVDTHIFRLARNLGLVSRATLDMAAVEEITRGLARFDPDDPTGFDFALCHMGMLQGCPSRADEAACRGCGVKEACVHWRAPSARRPASAGRGKRTRKVGPGRRPAF